MSKKVMNVLLNEMPEQNRFVRGLRAYVGFKQIGIEYKRDSRASGEVKYTFRKLLTLAADGLFDFSVVPLRLASFTGMIISSLSFALGLFSILHRIPDFKIFGYSPVDVPGLASLAVGLFFIGGIVLLILAIIREYLGRIYFEVKRRPGFIVEEIYTSKTHLARTPNLANDLSKGQ